MAKRKQPTTCIFHLVLSGCAVCAPSSRVGPGLEQAQPEDLRHLVSRTFKSDKEFQGTEVFENINSGSCRISQMKMQIQYNA